MKLFMKEKTSTGANGGTYISGFLPLAQVKALVALAEATNQDAVGFNNVKRVDGAKWQGLIAEVEPFKLKEKK